MNFFFSLDSSPPDVTVRASGELDLFTSHQLTRRLHEVVDAGCRRVLLDFAEVSFVDAAAMRVLDRFRTQLSASGGSLQVVAWSQRFQQVCRMTGLERIFQLPEALPA